MEGRALGGTLGNTINVDLDANGVSDLLTHTLTHELVHVWQWQTMGPGFAASYVIQAWQFGFGSPDISYENQAYSLVP